jgi:hypothetical protein
MQAALDSQPTLPVFNAGVDYAGEKGTSPISSFSSFSPILLGPAHMSSSSTAGAMRF